jgi:hypothetical protein
VDTTNVEAGGDVGLVGCGRGSQRRVAREGEGLDLVKTGPIVNEMGEIVVRYLPVPGTYWSTHVCHTKVNLQFCRS